MAVTWNVSTLERNVSDDGVTIAHWQANDSEVVGTGDDAVTHSGGSYGTCGFTPDSTDADFVAYADITLDTAVEWAKASLGADAVTATETSIADQITLSKTPVTFAGVPW